MGIDGAAAPVRCDPDTGLPPDGQALVRQRLRLERIRAAAEKARALVEQARSQTRFDFAVRLPDLALEQIREPLARLDLLSEYRRCIDLVSDDVARADWPAAVARVEAFIESQPQEPEDAWTVIKALKTGMQGHEILHEVREPLERLTRLAWMDLTHPLLEPLRQQLQQLDEAARRPLLRRHAEIARAAEKLCRLASTRPRHWPTAPLLDRQSLKELQSALAASPPEAGGALQLNKAVHALLQAAGPNKAALLALAGDVEGVAAELKSSRERLPHNLGVAALARLEQQRDRTGREELSLALSCAALFACCEPYRRRLAEASGAVSAEAGAALQDQVRAGLESLFRQAGLVWGGPTQPHSWGCQWEAECLAVRRLQAGDHQRLTWPFGPALVRFYGLEQELQVVLSSGGYHFPPRPCYGPCAAAEVLVMAGDPEAALRALPDCTEEMARSAPGYAAASDPLAALRQDVNGVRADAWLGVLRRQQFQADTPPSQAEALASGQLAACRALLGLIGQGGGQLADRFCRTLRVLFDGMKEQLERPNALLRRRATVEDGKARRHCMDAVIEHLRQAPRQPWLDDCLQRLLLRRADLLLSVVFLLFDWWHRHDKSLAVVLEMLDLAERAVRDAPNDPHAHVVRAQMLTLKLAPRSSSEAEREELVAHLRDLQLRAAGLAWPPASSRMINLLLEMVEKPDDLSDWMAAMLPSRDEEGGDS
jgi:hypothetical protein